MSFMIIARTLAVMCHEWSIAFELGNWNLWLACLLSVHKYGRVANPVRVFSLSLSLAVKSTKSLSCHSKYIQKRMCKEVWNQLTAFSGYILFCFILNSLNDSLEIKWIVKIEILHSTKLIMSVAFQLIVWKQSSFMFAIFWFISLSDMAIKK